MYSVYFFIYTPLADLPYCPLFAPKILHNLCFSFLLGITAVPREIENNAYAKFRGANMVGDVQVAYVLHLRFYRLAMSYYHET